MKSHDPRLVRLDSHRWKVMNAHGVEATLFASDEVPVEGAAVTELTALLDLKRTVERVAEVAPRCFDVDPELVRVAVTPDFHKAQGVPVGTVLATRGFLVPQAIGSDINCGMRLHTTDLPADRVVAKLDALEESTRRLYFEGGRAIPMTRSQREALFTGGLSELLNAVPSSWTDGLWPYFHELKLGEQLDRIDARGSLLASQAFGLDDFLGPSDRASRDSQIGSIGGGNHFVEVQRVEKIFDRSIAFAWGLKPGMTTVMVHTGSVSIGHLCGTYFRDAIREIYPKTLKYPENGVFPLPEGEQVKATFDLFRDGLHNAANFAFANRMFLAIMAWKCLMDVCGATKFDLLYDAPHNFVWRGEADGEPAWIHRKGACPARSYEAMAGTPFEHYGEPVLVPGSMGASSFILVGQGRPEALESASHGAGRALSRSDAIKGRDQEFADFLKAFRVVTPVDLRRADLRARRDILEKKLEELKQEAPFAYKGIGPVVKTLEHTEMARPVAELVPLMTLKG